MKIMLLIVLLAVTGAVAAILDGPVPIVSIEGIQDGPDPSDQTEWLVLQKCDADDCLTKAIFACSFSYGLDTARVNDVAGTCSYTCKDGSSGHETCKKKTVVVM